MNGFGGILKQKKVIAFSEDFIYSVSKPYDHTVNTFEIWIKLKESNRGNYSIVGSFTNDMYPCISLDIRDGHPSLLWGEEHYVHRYTFKEVDLLTNEWVYLAVVRDFSSSEARCYVNGALAGRLKMQLASRELRVGAFTIGGNCTYSHMAWLPPFPGRIGLISLYSSVRTGSEIMSDMTSPEKCSSLIAQYKFFNDKILSDASGNGYHAVKIPAPSYYISKKNMPTLKDYSYTFAVVGNTQTIARSYSSDFHKIYDYILDNKDSMNIKYVIGLGGITNSSHESEWSVAMESITRLEGHIPFSLARGNHDTTQTFDEYYPYEVYKHTVDGTYNNSMVNSWKAFVAGKRRFIIFTLDYGPSESVLDWASEIIRKHPEHNVIITTHSYLFRNGELHDESYPFPPSLFGGVLNGDQMWEKFMRKHKNIVMTLCGNISTDNVLLRHDIGNNGNIIATLLLDSQDIDTTFKGLGMVATLHFRDEDNTVQVRYYSTIKKKYFCKSAQYSFKLSFVGEETAPHASARWQ
ncbi:MAG: metallophosphoesterase [Clostridia bacterium]|nr:metallophosphoesterase [Clostridia bacterium]